jgi:hypothetical protein
MTVSRDFQSLVFSPDSLPPKLISPVIDPVNPQEITQNSNRKLYKTCHELSHSKTCEFSI